MTLIRFAIPLLRSLLTANNVGISSFDDRIFKIGRLEFSGMFYVKAGAETQAEFAVKYLSVDSDDSAESIIPPWEANP